MVGNTFQQFLVSSACALALPLGTAHAGDLLSEQVGAAGSGYGATVALVGDLDGNGALDLLVGAPDDATGGAQAGAVFAVDGLTGLTLHTWHGQPGERLGAAVGHAGDQDLDGTPDVILGAPGGGKGRAYLFSGADGALLGTLDGLQAGSAFGSFVGTVGDVDADGFEDLIVGAPGEDAGGETDVGVVRILSGADGAVLVSAQGDGQDDHFGSSGAGSPPPGSASADLDHDPIIGAKQESTIGRGFASIRNAADLGELVRVDGEASAHAGTTVARIGDVDGDGVADVAVGTAPTDANGAPAGDAYVTVRSGASGATLFEVHGPAVATGFGSVLAGVGDVDGDGVDDLAIGEPGADLVAHDAGAVHIVSGSDGSDIAVVSGSVAGGRFGGALSEIGDVDLDGRADVVVGAPGSDGVFVLSFTTWDEDSSGVAGALGVPKLRGVGAPVADGETVFNLSNAAPMATADLVLGHMLVVHPGVGVLVPFPDIVIQGGTTDAEGQAAELVAWDEQLTAGTLIYAQYQIADATAPAGVARSNTVSRTVE